MFEPDLRFQKQFEEIAEATSPTAALNLCAFFEGVGLYIPATIGDDHLITAVVGRAAADALAYEFGGQTIAVPNASAKHLRLAGKVWVLLQQGCRPHTIAKVLGVSHTRVNQIKRALLAATTLKALQDPQRA